MDREIMPKESIILPFPTFEEFKTLCLNDTSCKSTRDRLANAYDKIPMYIRLLTNFDPTGGFISYFSDALSEIKAERNEEKLWKTLYELFKALRIIDQKQGKINQEYFESQVIALTEMYFDYSMSAYQLEKIEIFRNAFISGVLDYNKTLDEKENIFNIIRSLTIEQMRILKFCHEDQQNRGIMHIRHGIGIHEIADGLKLELSYVDQLCQDLNGKGLLVGILSSRSMDALVGYNQHRISSYLEHLIKYIIEPV